MEGKRRKGRKGKRNELKNTENREEKICIFHINWLFCDLCTVLIITLYMIYVALRCLRYVIGYVHVGIFVP